MKKFSLICAILMLTGCAQNYTCGQFPSSGCQSVSTVYEKTNDGFHDYRKTLFDEKSEKKTVEKQKNSRNRRTGRTHQTLNYVTPGDPILAKPTVMRVLINAWVDQDKDLNSGGFIYLRLKDSEWIISH
jgi:type IV conjugative transfer system lipoprotein TraV